MQPIVGIDASRSVSIQRTGTENYSFELLRAIGTLPDTNLRIRLYTNQIEQKQRDELARIGTVRAIPFPRFWTHARLSTEMVLRPPDALFVPSHVIPLVHPRSVVTVHDLGYLHEPDAHPPSQRRMLDLTTRWNARVARRIIAISETTRRDLIDRYRVPAAKIVVIHHGVSGNYRRASDSDIAAIRARYSLPDQFVLALGTIQPRKNLGRLAEAVAQVRARYPGLALVTAGRRGWMADQVVAEIERRLPTGGWIEPGYVAPDDVPALISAATVVALVSTFEGFGLPVLEAFACGTPLVISDTPALVEVAGGAALVASTRSAAEMAGRIEEVLADESLRAQHIASGMERAREFTWERAARETIVVIKNVLTGRE